MLVTCKTMEGMYIIIISCHCGCDCDMRPPDQVHGLDR